MESLNSLSIQLWPRQAEVAEARSSNISRVAHSSITFWIDAASTSPAGESPQQ
jgi:hypothetical protein